VHLDETNVPYVIMFSDAVQTKCGHRLCEGCVDHLFAGLDKAKCPVMEEGCDELSKQDINRDTSARREIRLLPVCCVCRGGCGCQDATQWKQSRHIEVCEYRPVDCPLSVMAVKRRLLSVNWESTLKMTVFSDLSNASTVVTTSQCRS